MFAGWQPSSIRIKTAQSAISTKAGHPPGLNSLAPGLKEKLLARGLSLEHAEVEDVGVAGCPLAAAAMPASGGCAVATGSSAAGEAAAAVLPFVGATGAHGGGGEGAEAASASGVACSDGDSAVSEAEVEEAFPPSWLKVRSFSRRSSRLAARKNKFISNASSMSASCWLTNAMTDKSQMATSHAAYNLRLRVSCWPAHSLALGLVGGLAGLKLLEGSARPVIHTRRARV